jgi:predicted kinase
MSQLQGTAHFIFGPTAAGKSTFARKLATESNGVRFAIDDWMHALFSADKPERMDMTWALARVGRCQALIWSVAQQVLSSGTDVILESGLHRATDRNAVKVKVEQAGYAAIFHFIDAELAIRRERVLRRNRERGETFSFEVTPPMFEAMEAYFEPPSDNELVSLNCVRELGK